MASLYDKQELIGSGSFGDVYKGVELSSGRAVALKLVDLEKADEEIEVIQREIEVMSQISNPFVVQYYTSLMRGSTLWIVMEHMAAGSLKSLLDSVGPFPEDAIASIMKALCKGLDYVHKGNKLHRDIKTANILLSDSGDVKLADFGVAGQMTMTMRQRNTVVGSPFWMAPEIIQESLYDQQADIWSVGITAMELANGLPPYATEHPYRALMLIPKNDPPRLDASTFSKSFRDFVAACLQKAPHERSSAEQLLTHPFLRKARGGAVRELLRKRECVGSGGRTDEDEDEDEGEDEDEEDSGTMRLNVMQDGKTPAKMNGSAMSGSSQTIGERGFQFDFGGLDDGLDVGVSVAADGGRTPTAGTAGLSQRRERDLGAAEEDEAEGQAEGRGEEVGEGRVRESEVLTELVLPVISQVRADVDAHGYRSSELMGSLGSLEVVFLECERARKGSVGMLMEALIKAALVCESDEVRRLIKRCYG